MVSSTSFRISAAARSMLADRAARDGVSSTSLLERLIAEGITTLDYPGIVFRGPGHYRRAAVAAGPDVWEIVSRLRDLDGPEEERIETLSAESDLVPRQIRMALDYAAAHPDEIGALIDRNRAAAASSEEMARSRRALLA